METLEKVFSFVGRRTTVVRALVSFILANLTTVGIGYVYQLDRDAEILAVGISLFFVFLMLTSKKVET